MTKKAPGVQGTTTPASDDLLTGGTGMTKLVGTGNTAVVPCVLVAKGASAPTGLPTGTLVFELAT